MAISRRDWLSLSEREREILCLVIEGRSVDDIVAELVLKRNTVYSYLKSIGNKIGCSSHVYTIRIHVGDWGWG